MRNIGIKYIGTVVVILCCSCSDSGYEILKKQYPQEKFDILFAVAKKSLINIMNQSDKGQFREIHYGNNDRGVFVRLTNNGNERGCLAFVKAVSSIEEAVQAAVINAAFFDRRYQNLSKKEFSDLEIEISIIDRLIRINNYLNFTLGLHTVYITYLNRSAIMQGQIATERGYTREQFLKAICRKGEIPEDKYKKKNVSIYRANTIHMKRRFVDINTDK